MVNAEIPQSISRRTCDASRCDDRQILARIANRDSERALAELMLRYGGMVYSAAYRISGDRGHSEEIAQDVFLLVMKKAGALAERQALGAWLHRCAVNMALSKVRGLARRRRYESELERWKVEAEETTGDRWVELLPVLDAVINGISEKLRKPVTLCYLEGLTQREAATLIGCSESTLSRRLKDGIEELRRGFLKRGVGATSACIGVALTKGAKAGANEYRADALIRATLFRASKAVIQAGTASLGTTLGTGFLMFMKTKQKAAIASAIVGILAVTTTAIFFREDVRDENSDTLTNVESSNIEASGAVVDTAVATPETASWDPSASLSLEEKRRLLTSVAFVKSPQERWEILQKIGFQLSLEDVEQLPKGAFMSEFMWSIVEVWLRKDANAAVSWFEDVGMLNGNLLLRWAEIDAPAALEYARNELPGNFPKRESLVRSLSMIKEPRSWIGRLSAMEDAAERDKVIGELGFRWLESDPASAMAWLASDESLSENERARFLSAGLHEVAQIDPDLAFELLPEMKDFEDRRTHEFHVRETMKHLAIRDLGAAVELLDTFSALDRPSTVEGIAGGYAKEDTAAAMQWALTLGSEDLPKAIAGIALEADPEAYELLVSTMLERPASRAIDASLMDWIGLQPDYLEDDARLFNLFLNTRSQQMGAAYAAVTSQAKDPLGQVLWKGARALSRGIAQSEGPLAAIEWLSTIPIEEDEKATELLPDVLRFWAYVGRDDAIQWLEASRYSEEQKTKLRGALQERVR